MSLPRARALGFLSLTAAVSTVVVTYALPHHSRTSAGPGYNYICVGGTDLEGHPITKVCLPVPTALQQ